MNDRASRSPAIAGTERNLMLKLPDASIVKTCASETLASYGTVELSTPWSLVSNIDFFQTRGQQFHSSFPVNIKQRDHDVISLRDLWFDARLDQSYLSLYFLDHQRETLRPTLKI